MVLNICYSYIYTHWIRKSLSSQWENHSCSHPISK